MRRRDIRTARRAHEQQQWERPPEPQHEFDDDGCCVHCDFDGAEWHSVYAGREDRPEKPACRDRED